MVIVLTGCGGIEYGGGFKMKIGVNYINGE